SENNRRGHADKPLDIEMAGEVIGKAVEGLVNPGLEGEASALGAMVREKAPAKGVAGEKTMNIGPHDAAVLRGRAIGDTSDHREGPVAVGTNRRAEVDLVTGHRFTARNM